MPRGDRTGPMGMGPMTGRGAGYCAGYGAPGYMNPGPGGGRAWGGYGRGMAWRRGFGGGRGGWPAAPAAPYPYAAHGPYGGAVPAAPDPQAERAMLENQMNTLQSQIEAIRSRLDELSKEDKGTA